MILTSKLKESHKNHEYEIETYLCICVNVHQ